MDSAKRGDSEQFFKDIAALYVESAGAALEAERASLERDGAPALDVDLRGKTRRRRLTAAARKVSYAALPLAACLAAAVLYFNPVGDGAKDAGTAAETAIGTANTTTNMTATEGGAASETARESATADDYQIEEPAKPRPEITALSAKLPTGYALTATDYDDGMTIYYIKADHGGDIVMTAALPDAGAADVFAERRDYCVLTAERGGIAYKLTSADTPDDLAALAKACLPPI